MGQGEALATSFLGLNTTKMASIGLRRPTGQPTKVGRVKNIFNLPHGGCSIVPSMYIQYSDMTDEHSKASPRKWKFFGMLICECYKPWRAPHISWSSQSYRTHKIKLKHSISYPLSYMILWSCHYPYPFPCP